MENGYFQGQFPRHIEPQEDISKIPTPNIVPRSYDTSHLPLEVIKSSAVESLIQQNDDLMARLSVSLRRISILEGKITSSIDDKDQFKKKYENLKDQVLILKEKSSYISSREETKENEILELKDQIRFLELKYAEFHAKSRLKEKTFVDAVKTHARTIHRFKKYRNRLQEPVKKLKLSLAEALRTISKLEVDSSRERKQFETQILELQRSSEQKISEQKIAINSLKSSLTESTEHIQNQSKLNRENIQKLNEVHESKIDSILKELEETHAEKNNLLGVQQELVIARDKIIELENTQIIKERHAEEFRIRTQAEITDFQKSLGRYRTEAKNKALELEQSQIDLKQANAELQVHKDARQSLDEQVENLQHLWKDNQTTIEKFQEKTQSLQKLNQQLGIQLNEKRKEVQNLKATLDRLNLKAKDSFKSLKEEIVTVQKTSEMKSQQTESVNEIVGKIDQILTEIHSGYNTSK